MNVAAYFMCVLESFYGTFVFDACYFARRFFFGVLRMKSKTFSIQRGVVNESEHSL